MPDITMPDGQVVRFPDTMTPTQISGLIASRYPREVGAAGAALPPSERQTGGHYAFDGSNIPGYNQETGEVDRFADTYSAQGTSGLNEGLANILGAPIDIANAGIGLGMKGINALFGTDLQPSPEPLGGSAGLRRSMTDIGSIKPPTDDPGKQFVRRTMESTGASALPALGAAAKAAKPLQVLGGVMGSGTAGGAAAATSQQLLPDNPTAEMVAELVGSLGTAGATAVLKKQASSRAAKAGVPTVERLKEQAGALYDEAEKVGVTANQQQTQKLAADMRAIATEEGLISPTGRISEAYPKAREAIRLLDDYAQGDMTVPQMRTVRKALSDAAKSADGSEGRMASIMLDEFDKFVDPLAPQIQRGNQLYHAAMKGEKLETARELAGSRAGQFSGSGYENALRTEYRGLERNIIKGNERGFSDAEKKAVTKVAQGTPASNTARNVGRMAPTGPVSFAATAGIPYAIGSAMGGPVLGAAAATGASAIGYGGRAIATKMGMGAADDAELLARNQGAVPTGQFDMDTIKRLLAALAATQATPSQ